MYKQEHIERFESDWRIAKLHLELMAANPVMDGKYMSLLDRIKSFDSWVIDISDCARSDKD
jgi:hypothetical protein